MEPTPPYTYGLGMVGTASGSENTTRQNRTEVKPDGARKIRWGEGAGVALCGCGSEAPFGGCWGDGGGAGETGTVAQRGLRALSPGGIVA